MTNNKKQPFIGPKNRPKPKKQKGGMKMTPRNAVPRNLRSPHCRKAMAAAVNPFHPGAEGCAEMDDSFSSNLHRFPITYGAKLTTDASGEATMILLPNLYCGGLMLTGTTTGAVPFVFGSISDTTVPRQNDISNAPTPGNYDVFGIQPMPSFFNAQYSKHRIVRWGVVIRSIPNMASNQGRVRLAKLQTSGCYVPLTDSDLNAYIESAGAHSSFGITGGGTAVTSSQYGVDKGSYLHPYVPALPRWLYNLGVPVADPGVVSGGGTYIQITSSAVTTYEGMSRMPGNVSMTVAGLTAQSLLIRSKRTDVNMLRGTMLSAAQAGGMVAATTLRSTTTTADATSFWFSGSTQPLDIGVLDCTGHDGLMIKVDSAAINTGLIDIEIVYHIEASLRGNAANQFGRAAAESVLSAPGDAHAVRAVEHSTPHFAAVPTAFKELLGNTVEGLGAMVGRRAQTALSSSVSGILTRALAGIAL